LRPASGAQMSVRPVYLEAPYSPPSATTTSPVTYGDSTLVNAATLKLFDKEVCQPGRNADTVNPSWQKSVGYSYHLSHAHVQMARELGLNPGKLGKISNHRQEPWKAPLPQFIEHLYLKRFARERPQVVAPAEEWGRPAAAKKPARNAVPTNARIEQ
jgi:hypothetical protein